MKRHRRVTQAGAIFFSSVPNFIRIKIDEMINELIWGLSFNIEFIGQVDGKIFRLEDAVADANAFSSESADLGREDPGSKLSGQEEPMPLRMFLRAQRLAPG
jgi:hypothetical protein